MSVRKKNGESKKEMNVDDKHRKQQLQHKDRNE